MSHPTLSIDNWIYLTSGLTGGKVVSPSAPDRPPVVTGRTDFRFRPDGDAWEAADGGSQFGLSFDDFGRRFICYNRVQVQHVVISSKTLRRNPHLASSETVQNCPAETVAEPLKGHGAAARLFPISRNVTTADSHAGTFTAACAVTVWRGTGLPESYRGGAFSCDPTGNLVHFDRLEPNGATFAAHPDARGGRIPGEQRQLVPPGLPRPRPRRGAVRLRHVPQDDRAPRLPAGRDPQAHGLRRGQDDGADLAGRPRRREGGRPAASPGRQPRRGIHPGPLRDAPQSGRLVARHGPPAAAGTARPGCGRAAACDRGGPASPPRVGRSCPAIAGGARRPRRRGDSPGPEAPRGARPRARPATGRAPPGRRAGPVRADAAAGRRRGRSRALPGGDLPGRVSIRDREGPNGRWGRCGRRRAGPHRRARRLGPLDASRGLQLALGTRGRLPDRPPRLAPRCGPAGDGAADRAGAAPGGGSASGGMAGDHPAHRRGPARLRAGGAGRPAHRARRGGAGPARVDGLGGRPVRRDRPGRRGSRAGRCGPQARRGDEGDGLGCRRAAREPTRRRRPAGVRRLRPGRRDAARARRPGPARGPAGRGRPRPGAAARRSRRGGAAGGRGGSRRTRPRCATRCSRPWSRSRATCRAC